MSTTLALPVAPTSPPARAGVAATFTSSLRRDPDARQVREVLVGLSPGIHIEPTTGPTGVVLDCWFVDLTPDDAACLLRAIADTIETPRHLPMPGEDQTHG